MASTPGRAAWLITLFVACGIGQVASAQPARAIQFKNFEPGRGFSLLLPNDMLQDKQGFVWITSEEGISRFDGTRFQQFRAGDSSGYHADTPAWLAQDSTACIWVLQKSGLAWYDAGKKKFRYLPGVITEKMGAERMAITYDARRHSLWLGTNAGLYRYDITTRRLHKTPLAEAGNCVGIHLLPDGRLSYITFEDVFLYHPETRTIKKIGLGKQPFTILMAYLDSASGTLWLGLEEKGVMEVNLYTYGFQIHRSDSHFYSSVTKIPQITGDSILWLGTYAHGIRLFNTRTRRFVGEIRQDPRQPSGITSDRVYKIYPGPDGNGWVLNGSSLSIVSPFLAEINTEKWNGPAVQVCKVIKNPHRPGHYYLATRGKGLLDYNHATDQSRRLDPLLPSAPVAEQFIWGMYTDPLQNVWYAKSTDLIRLDKNGNKRTYRISHRNERLRILFFAFDPNQGVMWLIAERHVVRLLPESGRYSVIEIPPFPGSTKSARANHLLLDADKLWVGTDQGLVCLSTADGRELHRYAEGSQPGNNHIHWLRQDRRGNLWVANYKGGIKKLDARTGRYSAAGIPPEVAALPAVWLKETPQGTFWASTHSGLYSFHPTLGQLREVVAGSSFAFDEAFSRPEQEEETELLFMDTQSRVLRLSLTELPAIYQNMNRPVLTDFEVMDKPYNLPPRAQPPLLEHDQNHVSFTFSLPEFLEPEAMKLSYRLDGLEATWNEANEERRVSYANLGSGQYVFRVRAVNKFGNGEAKEAQFPFEVRPPFWEHPIFYALVLAFVAGTFYLIFNYRYQQKLRLLRLREHMARDLHDDMGSQLSSISILSQSLEQIAIQNPDLARHYLARIGETARQVMDSMSDIVWSINPEKDGLPKVTERMRDFAADLFEESPTELHFFIGEGLARTTLPPTWRHDFYLIFKEAVTNAARYAQAQNVHLRLERQHNQLLLSVQDDGQGFNSAHPPHSMGGNGLRNMKARAAKIGATLTIDSSPEIGTKLRLSIPLD